MCCALNQNVRYPKREDCETQPPHGTGATVLVVIVGAEGTSTVVVFVFDIMSFLSRSLTNRRSDGDACVWQTPNDLA